jgi:hypothetical protein
LDDSVVGPDPNKDLKKFFIIQNLTVLIYINYSGLL